MKKLTEAVLFVGSPNQFTDVRYSSGFTAVDPVVYVRVRRRGYLVVSPMEVGHARRQVHKGVAVISSTDLGLARKERARLSSWTLAVLRRIKIRRVRVTSMFPLAVARRLEKGGVRVRTSKEALFPERAVKSAREVAMLRRTQVAAVAALRTAIKMIARARTDHAGNLVLGKGRLTRDRVERAIDRVLLEHGCVAEETIVACGRATADPHERGSGPLRAGRPIVIDIFPRHKKHGYWGDITRTVVKGPAPANVRKMYRAVRAAQRAAFSHVKAGARVKSVHEAAQEVFDRAGFRTWSRDGVMEGFIHGTGHGVGLDIHEAPAVGQGEGRLHSGNVITVEPGLYYRSIGGVRIEDTVVVTRKGWKYLARSPSSLEV